MASDPTAWEYETLKPPRGVTQKEASDPKTELNELGADGWELVDTIEYVGGGTKFLVLKRPADAEGDGAGGSTGSSGDGDTGEESSDASTAEGQG
jgi:hypothetical protein